MRVFLNTRLLAIAPGGEVASAAMSWLEVEDRGRTRFVTIDRPGRRNAVPPTGWSELKDAFEAFEWSDQRVLVLRGAGDDFCAGADLDPERAPIGIVEGRERMKIVGAAALALHRTTKPTVAAVRGVAVGAGMNLALGCDIVIAGASARFSEIFVKRGLTLDFGGSWLLPRIVGLQRAKELALTGRIVGAAEALELGLAMEVVPDGALEGRVDVLVAELADGAPIAQMLSKQALDRSMELSFEEAVAWEGQSQAIALTTSDAAEGVNSFLEKRPPDFSGR